MLIGQSSLLRTLYTRILIGQILNLICSIHTCPLVLLEVVDEAEVVDVDEDIGLDVLVRVEPTELLSKLGQDGGMSFPVCTTEVRKSGLDLLNQPF